MTQNGSDRKDIAGINEGNHSRPHLIVFPSSIVCKSTIVEINGGSSQPCSLQVIHSLLFPDINEHFVVFVVVLVLSTYIHTI